MDQIKNVLQVFHLTKRFGTFTAVDDISFELESGEILGFLGANGAGKTTTIQMLMSTMIPTSGFITYFGKDFFTHRSEILQKVTFATTYIRLPGRLTVMENLDVYGQIYGISKPDRIKRIEHFLRFFGIWNLRDREAGVLSAGQITRVILAKAFIPYPSIVLLDEPTASLDPDIAIEVRSFIKEQQEKRNTSILLTSHNMAEVAAVCDRVLVLQDGKIIANNTPIELATSVKNVHLNLLISKNSEKAEKYLIDHTIAFTKDNHFFTIELDEHHIAKLLMGLAKKEIDYDQISINKPTLEDYFLSLNKTKRKLK